MSTNPLMGFECYLYKAGHVYRVAFPRQIREIPHMHRYQYAFSVYPDHTSNVEHFAVELTDILFAEKNDVDRNIIAIRVLCGLLGTTEHSQCVATGEADHILAHSKTEHRPVRKMIYEYISERFEVLFEEPFTVLEFVAAIPYSHEEIVRQIGYLVTHKFLRYAGAGVWGRETGRKEVLKKSLVFDPSRMDDIRKGLGQHKQPDLSRNGTRLQESKRVFIVHGHNLKLLDYVTEFLRGLQLEPIILHEQADKGRTIIEKFTEHAEVAYAVVLLTGDDIGGKAETSLNGLKPRPRQNVVFELGYFLGKIGRDKVCALYEDGVEILSDYSGVL